MPFLPLLVEAVGPRRPGGGWRRLRDRLSLVLRVLALAALVLALAGLAPAPAGPPPRALILVVDADPTTAAVEADGRSRYAHALDLAGRLLASRAWREVAVLEARAAPEVLVAPTEDRAAAAARLGRLQRDAEGRRRGPEDGPADLGAALHTARELARVRAPATLQVLTARAAPAAEASEDAAGETSESGGAAEIQLWGVGATREDQGFVRFDLAPTRGGQRVLFTGAFRNDAPGIRVRDLVLETGGQDVFRRTLELAPGVSSEAVEVELLPPKGGGWLRARLDGTDAFPPNDEVLAWLAPPLRPSVLVAHDGAVRPYTRAILDAMGDGIDVAGSGSVRAADLARARPRDVTIVDGVDLPPDALRPGAYLFLAPLGPGLPFDVGEPVREPLVWRSAPDHPLVADLDLGAAWIARGYPVSGAGLVPLAEADGAAVLAEGERAGVRYVVLGLDPEGSDLPLRAAFPLLVQAAIRRLAAVPLAPLQPFYAAGGALRPRLPLPGGPEATLTWPGGEAAVRLHPGQAAWTVPAGQRGAVTVRTATWTGHTAFVDVDPDRSVLPKREAGVPPPRARIRAEGALRWRRALLLAALLLLVLDLVLVARRDGADPGGAGT